MLPLGVSLSATALAALVGIPLGVALATARFRGAGVIRALVNTGMALPPVVVGLAVTILLWRTGPLGSLRLLYTPPAMVLAQFLVAAPLAAGLTRMGLVAESKRSIPTCCWHCAPPRAERTLGRLYYRHGHQRCQTRHAGRTRNDSRLAILSHWQEPEVGYCHVHGGGTRCRRRGRAAGGRRWRVGKFDTMPRRCYRPAWR